MSKQSIALSIAALIIGASGLGFVTYSIIQSQTVEGPEGPQGIPGLDGINGVNGVNGTLDNLVSVWVWMNQSTYGNYYNVTLHGNVYNNSDYISISDDVSFELTQTGWYRFTISFLWDGLSSPDAYSLWIKKNGLDYYMVEALESPNAQIYFLNKVAYVYSDGDDVFHLYCDAIIDTFWVIDAYQSNTTQFVIEYID